MKSLYRQNGMSIWGMATIFIVLAFFVLVMLKILPVYYQQFKLVKAFQNLKSEFSGESVTSAKIRRRLLEKFSIDDINIISSQDIIIERSNSGGYQVTADVDVRRDLVGNISLVVAIHQTVELD